MVTQEREVLLYRDSSDIKVSSAGIEMKTGRKWKAQEAVDQAESLLQRSKLVGTVASRRAGLGSNARPSYNKTDKMVMANQPDIVVVDKHQRTAVVIDVAIPRDSNIRKKEQEKMEKA